MTLPSQPIPWANRLATVTTDPGNEFSLSALPYFQMAPGFAIVGVRALLVPRRRMSWSTPRPTTSSPA